MELVKWEAAKQAIIEAHSVNELSKIRDQAEAARYALKQAGEAPEIIKKAEEIKLRAERRAGQVLKEKVKHGGDRKSTSRSQDSTLKDLGITKNESSKWQKIAEIPEDKFETYLEVSKEITTSGAIKIARKEEQEKKANFVSQSIPDGEYNVIYADPPWKYDHSRAINRDIENHYPTMDFEDIKGIELPVSENAVCFMWATAPKLKEALVVLDAWGFEYRTHSIWDKNKIGLGYWFRGQHELLLIGVKGNFSPPPGGELKSSVYREDRTKHSKKPNMYYSLIELYFPNGKYLELFARNKHSDKWTTWGNE